VVIFSVEEVNIPGIGPSEMNIGVVMQSPPELRHMGFGTAIINVEEEGWKALGVQVGQVKTLRADLEGSFRVDRVIQALLDTHPQYLELPLSTWIRQVLDIGWGRAPYLPVPPECQPWFGAAYQRILEDNLTLWGKLDGINRAPNPQLTVCVHFLPAQMFRAVLKCAKAGWSPILPQWQTLYGYQYNRSWENPCTGSEMFTDAKGRILSYAESKLLSSPAAAGFTLHVPSASNAFRFQVPPEWGKIYLAVMEEMAKTPVPKGDYAQMQGMLQAAACNVPTLIVNTDGSVNLYDVKGATNAVTRVSTISTTLLGTLPYKEVRYPPPPKGKTPMTKEGIKAMVETITGKVTLVGENLREQVREVPHE
jgi:hypothetical protein